MQKRWSASLIIDRVLEFIPELENETKKLTLKKNFMLLAQETQQNLHQPPHLKVEAPTVSVHEVKEGQVVIQICLQRDREDVISKLIWNVEAQGMCIESASTFHICDDSVCCHLHIQVCVFNSFVIPFNFHVSLSSIPLLPYASVSNSIMIRCMEN